MEANKSLIIRLVCGVIGYVVMQWTGLSEGADVLGWSIDGTKLTTGVTGVSAFLPDILAFLKSLFAESAAEKKRLASMVEEIYRKTVGTEPPK